MVDTAKAWADRLCTGHLPHHLTWLAWKTTILKTLEYLLPTMTLTHQPCNKLTSIISKIAWYHALFSQDLLCAPLKMGRQNIPNLYVEQGIALQANLILSIKKTFHRSLLHHSCEALKVDQ
jgi:hypothetical protein